MAPNVRSPVFGSLTTSGAFQAVSVRADGEAAEMPPLRPRNLKDSSGRPETDIFSTKLPRQPLAMCLAPSLK